MSIEVVKSRKHGVEVWLVWILQPGQGMLERSLLSEQGAMQAKALLEQAARARGYTVRLSVRGYVNLA